MKIITIKFILALCLGFISLSKVNAQYSSLINNYLVDLNEQESAQFSESRNLFYGGIGTALLYFPAYIYYERKLNKPILGPRLSTFASVGTGIAAHWEGQSAYISSKFGLLIGKSKAHLETSIGLSYFYKGDLQNSTPPIAFSIGYRAQKPDNKHMFRTGVSWPEAIYLGWGFSF
jgi:hypothetical protein